jgi:hypothetical protein
LGSSFGTLTETFGSEGDGMKNLILTNVIRVRLTEDEDRLVLEPIYYPGQIEGDSENSGKTQSRTGKKYVVFSASASHG